MIPMFPLVPCWVTYRLSLRGQQKANNWKLLKIRDYLKYSTQLEFCLLIALECSGLVEGYLDPVNLATAKENMLGKLGLMAVLATEKLLDLRLCYHTTLYGCPSWQVTKWGSCIHLFVTNSLTKCQWLAIEYLAVNCSDLVPEWIFKIQGGISYGSHNMYRYWKSSGCSLQSLQFIFWDSASGVKSIFQGICTTIGKLFLLWQKLHRLADSPKTISNDNLSCPAWLMYVMCLSCWKAL